MKLIESFTIGSATYNCAMASAAKQDELLSIMTQSIVSRAVAAARGGTVELGDEILVPMLMALDYQTKQRVASILMCPVMLNGSNQRVDVNDFQGRMVEYHTLLSRLIVWNLSDFFTWLSDAANAAQQAPKALEVQ